MTIMFCTKCGNKFDDKVNFCSKCGSPIEKAFPEQKSKSLSRKVDESEQPRKSKGINWKTIFKVVIGIWATVTLIDAVISIFMFFTVGVTRSWTDIVVWALALGVVLKLDILHFKKRTN